MTLLTFMFNNKAKQINDDYCELEIQEIKLNNKVNKRRNMIKLKSSQEKSNQITLYFCLLCIAKLSYYGKQF